MSTAAASSPMPTLVPTSSAYRNILVYDSNAPRTVIASVATAVLPADGSGGADYIEFHVTCAAPCPSDFPPQTVTQKSGSIWGGHHALAGTTTAWDCNVAIINDEGGKGRCYTTTLSSGETVPTTGSYTRVGTCQVYARSKMMLVTAGFDDYLKAVGPSTDSPEEEHAYIDSVLSSASCTKDASTTSPSSNESKQTTAASTKGASTTESTPTATTTNDKSDSVTISRGLTLLATMFLSAIVLQA